ncbi:MAG: hypothetical protein IKE95_03740 [Methanobrevibacter sp.]|nr:hypothetical protein [Methanobrevibacter sp.]
MKRMFDKEEIVDLIQEESPKIEVDSELSETSENPVENKVIFEALADKQDSLPDTTGQTDKFLKVGSEGLEWAEAGGGGGNKLYLHRVAVITGGSSSKRSFTMNIITSDSTPFTRSSFRDYYRAKFHPLYILASSYEKNPDILASGLVNQTDDNGIIFGIKVNNSSDSNDVKVMFYKYTLENGTLTATYSFNVFSSSDFTNTSYTTSFMDTVVEL